MLHPEVPASFEDVQEAHEVALKVRIRVRDAVADPRLRGEVHDLVEPFLLEERIDGGLVGDVQVQHLQPERLAASFLEADVVIVIVVVHADNLVSPLPEGVHQLGADESGRAGHEYLHSQSVRYQPTKTGRVWGMRRPVSVRRPVARSRA